jgi:hypothetical protein
MKKIGTEKMLTVISLRDQEDCAGSGGNEAAETAIEGRAMVLKKRMVTVRMGRCDEMSSLGTKGKCACGLIFQSAGGVGIGIILLSDLDTIGFLTRSL